MSLEWERVADTAGALGPLYRSHEHQPYVFSVPAFLCWRAARTHFAYAELKGPGNLCLAPEPPMPNQGLMLQECKYYSLLTSDLDSWGSTCTVSRASPHPDSPCCPKPRGALLGIIPSSVFPLSSLCWSYFFISLLFFSLIHTNTHLRGTKHMTRCVLESMACSCCWPGNHNDIVVFACACMNLVVFPVAWMDCYSIFQWVKYVRTIWERNMNPDCCLKIFLLNSFER